MGRLAGRKGSYLVRLLVDKVGLKLISGGNCQQLVQVGFLLHTSPWSDRTLPLKSPAHNEPLPTPPPFLFHFLSGYCPEPTLPLDYWEHRVTCHTFKLSSGYPDCPEVLPHLQSLLLGEDSTAPLFHLTGRHRDHSGQAHRSNTNSPTKTHTIQRYLW